MMELKVARQYINPEIKETLDSLFDKYAQGEDVSVELECELVFLATKYPECVVQPFTHLYYNLESIRKGTEYLGGKK